MNKKFINPILLVFILSSSGCESMMAEHPVDKMRSLYEVSMAFFLAQADSSASGRVILCSLNNTGNPNVRVTLSNLFGSHTAYTDSDGNFIFNNIKPGSYTITASKQGHQFIPESQSIAVGGSGLSNVTFETSVTWEKTIGGSGWEKAYSVQQTNDCGYVAAGSSDEETTGNIDFYVIKLDMFGNREWEQKIGGANTEIAYSVNQNSDGTYIAAGLTFSYGNGMSDVWVVKLDNDNYMGRLLWNKAFGGPQWDEGHAIHPAADNGYILTGGTESYGAGGSDFWVIKLDSDGNKVWDKTYGGFNNDEATAIQQTGDGGYIVCGNSENDNGYNNIMVNKIDSIGNIIWSEQFSKQSHNEANDIMATTDEGYVVAGYTGNEYGTALVMKLGINGDDLWHHGYGGTYMNKAYSVQQSSDGGYMFVGYTYSFVTTSNDIYVVKLDSSGNLEWQQIFDGNMHGDDVAHSVEQTSDGGYIISGYTTTQQGTTDMWILKLNQNGDIIQ